MIAYHVGLSPDELSGDGGVADYLTEADNEADFETWLDDTWANLTTEQRTEQIIDSGMLPIEADIRSQILNITEPNQAVSSLVILKCTHPTCRT